MRIAGAPACQEHSSFCTALSSALPQVFTDSHVEEDHVKLVAHFGETAHTTALKFWTDGLILATNLVKESCPPKDVIESPSLLTDEGLQAIVLDNKLKDRLVKTDVKLLRASILVVKDTCGCGVSRVWERMV